MQLVGQDMSLLEQKSCFLSNKGCEVARQKMSYTGGLLSLNELPVPNVKFVFRT